MIVASRLDSYLKRCATTPSFVYISGTFTSREFAVALQHLEPDKAPGPDFICPKFILHTGAPLKS